MMRFTRYEIGYNRFLITSFSERTLGRERERDQDEQDTIISPQNICVNVIAITSNYKYQIVSVILTSNQDLGLSLLL